MNNAAPSIPVPGLLHRIAAVVRRVIGVPDYEGYVQHVRRCHPDQEPVSSAEFNRMKLEDKYSRPGTRCC